MQKTSNVTPCNIFCFTNLINSVFHCWDRKLIGFIQNINLIEPSGFGAKTQEDANCFDVAIPHAYYRRYTKVVLGKTFLFFDHRLMSIGVLVRKWPLSQTLSIQRNLCFKMFKMSASDNLNISHSHPSSFVSTTTIPITVYISLC